MRKPILYFLAPLAACSLLQLIPNLHPPARRPAGSLADLYHVMIYMFLSPGELKPDDPGYLFSGQGGLQVKTTGSARALDHSASVVSNATCHYPSLAGLVRLCMYRYLRC